jgi:peptidoglycan/LPS O-acetylase OafA/YrhL
VDLDGAAAAAAGALAVVATVTAAVHVTQAGDGAGHVLQLDAMRGLAALVVLAGHLAQVFWQPFVDPQDGWVHLFATTSRHAVLVFFLLSGYLISDGIRRNVRQHGAFAARPYALARAARLWPPLLGAVGLTALAAALWPLLVPAAAAGLTLQARAWEYGTALLFVGGLERANPVLWSLNIEAWLYFIAGLLAWAWTRRPRAGSTDRTAPTLWGAPAEPMAPTAPMPPIAPMARVVPVALVALTALAVTALSLRVQALFLVCALVWVIGAGVALLPQRWQRARRGVCATALLLCVAVLLLQPQWLSILEPQPLVQLSMQLLAALAYATLLFDLRWPGWALRAPRLVAGFSYTLYLVHWPMLLLVMALGLPHVQTDPAWALLATLAGAVLALSMAWALGALLERPADFRAAAEALLAAPRRKGGP